MSYTHSTERTGGTARHDAVVAEVLDWWCGDDDCALDGLCGQAYKREEIPPPHPGLRVVGACDEVRCEFKGLFQITVTSLDEVEGPCPECGLPITVDVSRDPF